MRRPLHIEADLDLTVDGHPVAVRGQGKRVVIEVDEPQTAWRVMRAHRPGADLVRTLAGLLRDHDVDVEVQVGGRAVGRIGSEAEPGLISRALGVPVEVTPPPVPRKVLYGAAVLAALGGLALILRRR
ncbi:hypothetical protein [Rubricoccus marinus]|uniref:Uncharacterized protein n=1 Tax=Rubricoccus marinus TaxID=716817 RepID=A0A259U1Q1_9BACT|nr:hypothetical protein [Rubricoccus marinus]OZC03973.1 hypothetical protein BSZ36_13870 [Rubricoccus marinus]